jgi:adenylyl-sulfate kinase
MDQGFTIWLTGLSGAGKTTIARGLATALLERGRRVEVLDGDEIRQNLSQGLGYGKEDRDTNVRRIAYVASLLTRHGVVVITAAISPYRDTRWEARQRIGRFVEVYVKCSLDELIRRDVKGLYARALRGEIPHFTGVSDPYEEPLSPEVLVDSEQQTPEESLARVLGHLRSAGYLAPTDSQVHPEGRPLVSRLANGLRAVERSQPEEGNHHEPVRFVNVR